jgi:hypothetical protein
VVHYASYSGRRNKWTQSHPTPPHKTEKQIPIIFVTPQSKQRIFCRRCSPMKFTNSMMLVLL